MSISNLTRSVLEATVGDYAEKGLDAAKKYGKDLHQDAKNAFHKVKDFDIDRYRAGKNPHPGKLEKAREMLGGIKDDIVDRIKQNPKSAAALGAAGVIGTGYGAYRYLKSKKAAKKNK